MKAILAVAVLLLCSGIASAQTDCGKGNDYKSHGKGNPSCGKKDVDHDKEKSGDHDRNSGGGSTSTSSIGDISNYAGVSNSGNSFNLVTALGGNANQTQSQSSTATSQGNSSTQATTFQQVRQTASAISPDTFPTSPCFKTVSGSGQSGAFGLSFGAGKIDEGCDARETARLLASIGSRTAACKLIVSTKAAKNAGVTLADCLKN